MERDGLDAGPADWLTMEETGHPALCGASSSLRSVRRALAEFDLRSSPCGTRARTQVDVAVGRQGVPAATWDALFLAARLLSALPRDAFFRSSCEIAPVGE
ncbi:hypothetical protein GCM10017600_13830 [Streptosporangium carneum]|uniref:Uncharacterized protein n=1 Tax=Streptosporangium carneum TaxID=47481 RepID=A0A9W6MBS3_9ACTN|nr:hypothetical protein GCM10017600_13830 [Streptosporangium carneum]